MVSSTEQSAPTAAASVGEAQPSRIEPSTAKIMKTGGTMLRVVIHSFARDARLVRARAGCAGPACGRIRHRTKMYTR